MITVVIDSAHLQNTKTFLLPELSINSRKINKIDKIMRKEKRLCVKLII